MRESELMAVSEAGAVRGVALPAWALAASMEPWRTV